jgi:hypothetical protein
VNKRIRYQVALGLLVTLITIVPAFADETYVYVGAGDLTGSRSTSQGGIVASGDWQNNFQVSWVITPVGDNWSYSYTFSTLAGGNLKPAVSHFILELSRDAGMENFFSDHVWGMLVDGVAIGNDEFEGPKLFTANPGSPNLPSPGIWGIKFEEGGVTFTFISSRAPVWGDFYAKGGSDSTAWNTGLGLQPTEGTKGDFLPRPNTLTRVPEPSTLLLLGAGLLATAWFRRRN